MVVGWSVACTAIQQAFARMYTSWLQSSRRNKSKDTMLVGDPVSSRARMGKPSSNTSVICLGPRVALSLHA